MNINVLKYYIELYKQKNLNKAALNLFLTPQGLSKAITNLEKELGIQLLRHGYNQIQFTPDGDFFYQKAAELWELYADMLGELQERSLSPSGTLTIGIAYGVSKYLGTDFWETFRKKYENIRLNIIETTDRQVEQMLMDEIIETGISSCEYDDRIFEGKKLFSVPVHLLCAQGSDLYDRERIFLRDLEGEKIITLSDEYKSPEFLRKFLARHQIHADLLFSASEMSYIWDLCYQNKGITLIPAGSFPFLHFEISGASEHPLPLFREFAFSDVDQEWEIYLLRKRALRSSPPAQVLNRYITGHAKSLKNSE